MVQECNFDPVRDVQAVVQDGFVDLARANAMSSLPSSIQATDLMYNEIDDPNSIGARPRDTFEAAQASKVITEYKPKSKDA